MILLGAAAALGVVRIALPLNIHPLLGFRWAIAGGLCFLLFFFLTLQLLVGFGAENVVVKQANKLYEDQLEVLKDENKLKMLEKSPGFSADKFKQKQAEGYGLIVSAVHRTSALTFVWWLNLIAFLVAGFIFWIDVRKTSPIPKLEFRY
jgi:hypothetical protein